MAATEDLVATCERACVVLRTLADEMQAEEQLERARLLRRVVRALEHDLGKLGQAPFDETPLPGSTYFERLLAAIEDPRGVTRPLASRWLRRHARQAVVLVTEMAKALEVYGGELELVEGASRWLERMTDGPGDDQASSE